MKLVLRHHLDLADPEPGDMYYELIKVVAVWDGDQWILFLGRPDQSAYDIVSAVVGDSIDQLKLIGEDQYG